MIRGRSISGASWSGVQPRRTRSEKLLFLDGPGETRRQDRRPDGDSGALSPIGSAARSANVASWTLLEADLDHARRGLGHPDLGPPDRPPPCGQPLASGGTGACRSSACEDIGLFRRFGSRKTSIVNAVHSVRDPRREAALGFSHRPTFSPVQRGVGGCRVPSGLRSAPRKWPRWSEARTGRSWKRFTMKTRRGDLPRSGSVRNIGFTGMRSICG